MSKRGYHHGNLRQALIDATLRLIAERGPEGFTLNEAARLAGVSPAAPYRHFSGREAILEEVAREGFIVFADALEKAWNDGKPSPLVAFSALGNAYLAFAKRHPAHYIAMFESGLLPNASSDLARVSSRALDVLTRAAAALTAHLPPEKCPPAIVISQHVWALSHGIVELFARGKPGTRTPFDPADLLESGIGIYLRGLGILPPE